MYASRKRAVSPSVSACVLLVALGSHPAAADASTSDSDGDGYPDLEEYLNATDPTACDG